MLLALPLFAETQSSTRTISATWTDNPPIIDGELTDSEWQRAQIATNFFRAKEGSIHPAQLNTEVRILYDEHMLYIGVRCDEPDMKSLRETKIRRDSAIWQNDCIEVM
ncbi:MAG: hypothetical protein OXI59_02250, partial [Gemmatimonadota bacterium]|nr:hypothetical protein [Gemmatimonadota bacterium]